MLFNFTRNRLSALTLHNGHLSRIVPLLLLLITLAATFTFWPREDINTKPVPLPTRIRTTTRSSPLTKYVPTSTRPKMSKVIQFLAFGDSLTEGYFRMGRAFHPYTERLGVLFQEAGLKVQSLNTGVSGESTFSMKHRIHEALEEMNNNVQYAVVLGGTNDVGQADVDTIYDNLVAVHTALHEKGARTGVVTLPDMTWQGGPYAVDSLKELNDKLRSYASSNAFKTFLIDLAPVMPHGASDESKWWDDGIHFTPSGYDRFGELIASTLIPLIKQGQ